MGKFNERYRDFGKVIEKCSIHEGFDERKGGIGCIDIGEYIRK